jgi:hypothetical protein
MGIEGGESKIIEQPKPNLTIKKHTDEVNFGEMP